MVKDTQLKQNQKTPCSDCPWRRKSAPGWVGSDQTPENWCRAAHSEAFVECHVNHGNQCAGVATFRANVAKSPRSPEQLTLPPDQENVFSWDNEFIDHHRSGGVVSSEMDKQ